MVDGYGMTEAGTILWMPLDTVLLHQKAGAVGICGPLTRIRIVDERGQDVPDDMPGEILVAGTGVTSGYWNKPGEHAKVVTADGWFQTGDMGRRDAAGYVSIADRKKDMFLSGGENVYLVEINRSNGPFRTSIRRDTAETLL